VGAANGGAAAEPGVGGTTVAAIQRKSPTVAEPMLGYWGEDVGDVVVIAYGKVCSLKVT
jgi:hypothetical protein